MKEIKTRARKENMSKNKINNKKICNNYEFRRIYSKGKSFVSPTVVLYLVKNRYGTTRYGITASKKIGNAVKRNRSRRVIREGLLSQLNKLRPGFDLVLVARGKTPYVKSVDVEENLIKIFKKANLYRLDNI